MSDSKLDLMTRILEDLEWSVGRTGQPTSSGLGNGCHYEKAACPECGGIRPGHEYLNEYSEDYLPGHRSGCRIAEALDRETVILEGESGSLAL